MKIVDTYKPYDSVERDEIQYTVCRDYNHISRYRGYRQVIHEGSTPDRFVALETNNPFHSNTKINYYTVPASRENRLDIIAQEQLGSANYAWVIAYFNNISDGFTVREGQTIAIPTSISSLFSKGEILAPVSAIQLNLGTE